MENHILNQVFKERTINKNLPAIPIKITFYDWFKQVPHNMCSNWLLIRENSLTKLRKVGLRRIERELDVARFIRKQMALTAIIKALMTKPERNGLNHNYRFMLGDNQEITTTSESEFEGCWTDVVTSEFKVGQNLVNDLKKKCTVNKIKNAVKQSCVI